MKLQQEGGGKALFSKELSKANDAKTKVMEARAETRAKLQGHFLKVKSSASTSTVLSRAIGAAKRRLSLSEPSEEMSQRQRDLREPLVEEAAKEAV